MTRPRMFAIFFAISIGLSWVLVAVFANVWATPSPAQRAVSIVYQMPVLFAALVVQGPILRQPVLEPLGLNLRLNRWWLVAWLTPVLILAVGVLLAWVAFGIEPVLDAATYIERKREIIGDNPAFERQLAEAPPTDPIWFVLQALPAGVTINLVIALSTEVGWRGFLFREIQGSFWRRSLLIGLCEAAWFAPPAALGYLFDPMALWGGLLVAVWCVMSSPVWVYLRVRGESVVAVAVARGTMLALTAAAADLVFGAPAWVRPFYGVTGLGGVLVVLGLFYVHDRFAASRRLMG